MRLTQLDQYTASTINDNSEFYIAEYITSPVTISVSDPCVINWTAHGLPIGNALVFSTSGDLPTGIVAGTTYFVIASGYAADSFQISSVLAGTAIETTGSQSGTQTIVSYISKQISGLKLKSIIGNVANAVTFTPGAITVANTITHNLGTTDFLIELWDVSTGKRLEFNDIGNRNTTTVDVYFDENPAGNVRAVFVGKGGIQVDSRPYKTLTATISQAGASAPTFDRINENGLGFTPVWSYIGAGHYRLTYTSGFTTDGSTNVFLQQGSGTIGATSSYVVTTNYIDFYFDFNATPTNGLFDNSSLKIEIYS